LAGIFVWDAAMPRLKPAYHALLIANVLTTALALWQQWSISALLVPFWLQSMVLGMLHVRRILALKNFSTEGFTSNGQRVPEDRSGKRSTALFFALHYGFFHLFYLVFVFMAIATSKSPAVPSGQWLLLLLIIVIVTQYLTHRDNMRRDALGRPNIGGMMFLPYLRVIPMHLIIFIGARFGNSELTLLSFMAMKTLADLGMQWAEVGLQRGAAKSLAEHPGISRD
jgi:hypothetical protein